ncbi:MAG TPA: putative lipid II flippase FtsW [Gaiellaceae bacterium]|jgi:cell division protein FtsW|nr:putative lipid II flippase FtsW [Gaiellaceae bacterium]
MSSRPKRLQFEWNLLVLVTTALLLFGLVMVYSASSGSAALGNGNPLGFLERQVTYALIGVALLVVVSRLDLDRIRALAPTLVVTSLVLCFGVLAVGARINGARRWIDVGPLVFQPSELAKLALVVWTAAYLSRRRPPRTLQELGRPIGFLVLLFAVLVLVEPDLGTALTLLLVVGAILLVSGTRLQLLATAYGLVFALAAIAAWSSPYQRDRLLTFLDPWKDPTGAGLQNVQALISLGSGGIFGRGLGSGIEAYGGYLPEAHTDMMFAVVGEELGLVGVTLVIMAFCAFAYAGIRLAIGTRDPFAKRLAAGITALVCGQAAINMAAAVGLAPLTGIPLPFVSYGGSSLVMMLVGVGVLLNIARDGGRATAAVPDRGRRNGRARGAGTRRRGSPAAPGRAGDVRRVAGSRRGAARS